MLAISDVGNLPFSHYMLTRGVYEADQAKRIRDVAEGVLADLRALAEYLVHPRHALHDIQELTELMIDVPGGLYAKAADAVMLGQWDVLRLGHEPGDPDDDLFILLARAIIRRLGCEGRNQYLEAGHLLALSYLTGISPASFARHALGDFRRRGTTYLTAATLDELAELIRTLPIHGQRDSGRRDVLVKEVLAIADELGLVHSQFKDWQVTLPQKLLKCRTPNNLAYEWTGRDGNEEA